MAILAATTLGVDGSTLRAEVRADADLDDAAEYSLVVQTYDGPMQEGTRPIGSIQRLVSGAELRRGVQVSLVELRQAAVEPVVAPGRAVVVAWIEHGRTRLEYDARAARPRPGSIFGTTRRAADDETVQISLKRPLAA